MSSKIYKSKIASANPAITSAKQVAEQRSRELVNFSFKYLNRANDKFCYHPNEANYFIEFPERIKSISTITKQEIVSNRSSALRAHPIDWQDTTETCFNFPAEDEIVATPYQFSIGSNEHGRVHGFFIYTTFYLVWLDKNHRLYA
jgi:hypothetical protein